MIAEQDTRMKIKALCWTVWPTQKDLKASKYLQGVSEAQVVGYVGDIYRFAKFGAIRYGRSSEMVWLSHIMLGGVR